MVQAAAARVAAANVAAANVAAANVAAANVAAANVAAANGGCLSPEPSIQAEDRVASSAHLAASIERRVGVAAGGGDGAGVSVRHRPTGAHVPSERRLGAGHAIRRPRVSAAHALDAHTEAAAAAAMAPPSSPDGPLPPRMACGYPSVSVATPPMTPTAAAAAAATSAACDTSSRPPGGDARDANSPMAAPAWLQPGLQPRPQLHFRPQLRRSLWHIRRR